MGWEWIIALDKFSLSYPSKKKKSFGRENMVYILFGLIDNG